MDKLYVTIIGKGTTSRANLEALVEDYFYAKGKEVYLILAFDKTPSQGQVFAAQYAKDKGKDIVIFCKEGANVGSFPTASVSYTTSPISDALATSDNTPMLLWDDSDPECLQALEYCDATNQRAYNLCEGLTLVSKAAVTGKEPEPVQEEKPLTKPQEPDIIEKVLADIRVILEDALKKA